MKAVMARKYRVVQRSMASLTRWLLGTAGLESASANDAVHEACRFHRAAAEVLP